MREKLRMIIVHEHLSIFNTTLFSNGCNVFVLQ